ncbi:flagellar protein FlgN [Yoonia sp.]|jgi:hypothetical protein|uniref:flagellar protein FlgN n=1 Tax=Yoonia sp. TaxID=2212373 RepID=UPI0025EEA314|nr:flagellar protein FlgN [Yoonia sp.]
MSDTVTKQFLTLLSDERSAIRTAAFDTLTALTDPKARLFDALGRTPISPENLAAIQKKVTENQVLLSAAIAGVGAARDRLTALQNVREHLNVYDQSGHIAKVVTGLPGLEKKA